MSQWATDKAKAEGDPVYRIYAGYFCPRGGDDVSGGHFMLMGSEDFDYGCSGKGWDLYFEVDAGDASLLPEWAIRQLVGTQDGTQQADDAR